MTKEPNNTPQRHASRQQWQPWSDQQKVRQGAWSIFSAKAVAASAAFPMHHATTQLTTSTQMEISAFSYQTHLWAIKTKKKTHLRVQTFVHIIHPGTRRHPDKESNVRDKQLVLILLHIGVFSHHFPWKLLIPLVIFKKGPIPHSAPLFRKAELLHANPPPRKAFHSFDRSHGPSIQSLISL